MFVADLVRCLSVRNQIDFMIVSSYGDSTTSSGEVKLKKDVSVDVAGAHVLVVDDLIDTGR